MKRNETYSRVVTCMDEVLPGFLAGKVSYPLFAWISLHTSQDQPVDLAQAEARMDFHHE